MKCKLTYYVAGNTYDVYVYAINYKEAASTGNSFNPNAKLISANPTDEN